MEMNLIAEADIKVDSEEFCDANDDQANYDEEMASSMPFLHHNLLGNHYVRD